MRRPSMFSKDYYKIMRRRRIISVLTAALVISATVFLLLNKSLPKDFGRFISEINTPRKSMLKEPVKDNTVSNDKKEEAKAIDGNKNTGDNKSTETAKNSGQYDFKLSDSVSIGILYEKDGQNIKLTGIKQFSNNVSYDLKDDGKAIVFDNPLSSDIYICSENGEFKKLSPDFYSQHGEDGTKFQKSDIMRQYGNNYVWAARPKFLKDGRIVYQSNLPWFKTQNNIYIWVMNGDGSNNRCLFNTNLNEPAVYGGFTDDNKLIVEFGGNKHVVD